MTSATNEATGNATRTEHQILANETCGKELDDAGQTQGEDVSGLHAPVSNWLETADGFDYDEQRSRARRKSDPLGKKDLQTRPATSAVTDIQLRVPVNRQYEIELEPVLRLNKISALSRRPSHRVGGSPASGRRHDPRQEHRR